MSEKTISEHRKMVAMTGNLSDFQISQLKNWPYVAIEKQYIEDVYINYDFTKKDKDGREALCAGSVSYDFRIKGDLPYSDEILQRRLSHLVLWTKNLFWEDTAVEIKKKGKKWEI